MRFFKMWHVAVLLVAVSLSACATGNTAAEKRASILKMRSQTLAQLYKIKPGSRERIRNAYGYGVFSNVGVNVILLSAGGGWGVVHNNHTGKNTYMRMASGGVGIGLGVKDFRGVFVFDNKSKFDWFVNNGWDASGQADAAAKASDKGGAWAGSVDVAPGIHLYQITESGLALQATVQGTKYWKADELN